MAVLGFGSSLSFPPSGVPAGGGDSITVGFGAGGAAAFALSLAINEAENVLDFVQMSKTFLTFSCWVAPGPIDTRGGMGKEQRVGSVSMLANGRKM